MNRVYTRGLFKQILKDWEQVMFERQIETSKITRHLTTQNTDKNKYDVENEKWIPEELSSSVEKPKEKENDLLHLLPNNSQDVYNERED
jgi:hypothetical protein